MVVLVHNLKKWLYGIFLMQIPRPILKNIPNFNCFEKRCYKYYAIISKLTFNVRMHFLSFAFHVVLSVINKKHTPIHILRFAISLIPPM